MYSGIWCGKIVGINIDGKKLNHLKITDDLTLDAHNATSLKNMLNQLAESSRVEVVITLDDAVNRVEVAITLDDANIEYVRTYTYLRLIAFGDQTNIEIERMMMHGIDVCHLKRYSKSNSFRWQRRKKCSSRVSCHA